MNVARLSCPCDCPCKSPMKSSPVVDSAHASAKSASYELLPNFCLDVSREMIPQRSTLKWESPNVPRNFGRGLGDGGHPKLFALSQSPNTPHEDERAMVAYVNSVCGSGSTASGAGSELLVPGKLLQLRRAIFPPGNFGNGPITITTKFRFPRKPNTSEETELRADLNQCSRNRVDAFSVPERGPLRSDSAVAVGSKRKHSDSELMESQANLKPEIRGNHTASMLNCYSNSALTAALQGLRREKFIGIHFAEHSN
ncbi:hypothetical protein C8R45DRAFT_1065675 [Mycena sanguinolenta]|nr:hypothetical protein C8R45DRAFT_1065675 [Mycena sanguinolenta]